jgi:hypothetical protein
MFGKVCTKTICNRLASFRGYYGFSDITERLPPQAPRLNEDGDLAVTGAAEPWMRAQASLPGASAVRRRAIAGNRTAATIKLGPNQMSPAPLTPSLRISNNLDPATSIASSSWVTAARRALRSIWSGANAIVTMLVGTVAAAG